jgi:hypothetical protein
MRTFSFDPEPLFTIAFSSPFESLPSQSVHHSHPRTVVAQVRREGASCQLRIGLPPPCHAFKNHNSADTAVFLHISYPQSYTFSCPVFCLTPSYRQTKSSAVPWTSLSHSHVFLVSTVLLSYPSHPRTLSLLDHAFLTQSRFSPSRSCKWFRRARRRHHHP